MSSSRFAFFFLFQFNLCFFSARKNSRSFASKAAEDAALIYNNSPVSSIAFSTFDQVLGHYLSGGKPSPNKDALIGDINKNKLKPVHIEALKAFINTFEDTLFFSNPELQNPFN